MVLEIGSKLHTLLVEQNAALVARARSDHRTFNVYEVRGKRFIIVKSGAEVEQIFFPIQTTPPGDAVDTLRKLLDAG